MGFYIKLLRQFSRGSTVKLNFTFNLNSKFQFLNSKVPKLSFNERCSAIELCNDLVGLNCQEGICKCGASSYWKNSKCSNLASFLINFLEKILLNTYTPFLKLLL